MPSIRPSPRAPAGLGSLQRTAAQRGGTIFAQMFLTIQVNSDLNAVREEARMNSGQAKPQAPSPRAGLAAGTLCIAVLLVSLAGCSPHVANGSSSEQAANSEARDPLAPVNPWAGPTPSQRRSAWLKKPFSRPRTAAVMKDSGTKQR